MSITENCKTENLSNFYASYMYCISWKLRQCNSFVVSRRKLLDSWLRNQCCCGTEIDIYHKTIACKLVSRSHAAKC